MARGILSFFGGLVILVGIAIAAIGFNISDRQVAPLLVIVPASAVCFVIGATFLGFARVIQLLEQIASGISNSSEPFKKIDYARVPPPKAEKPTSSLPQRII